MQTSMPGAGIVMETTPLSVYTPGAFYVAVNEYAGYRLTSDSNIVADWSLADGEWHHYALVYDWDSLTADIVRVYRDGVQVTTHPIVSTSAAKLRAGTLFIGARNGSEHPFVGQLDDIKITGRALAPAEFMTKRSKPPRGMIISIM